MVKEQVMSVLRACLPDKTKSYLYWQVTSLLNVYRTSSFSQAGEDAVLRFLFSSRNISLDKISYLDIGSRHPTVGSNTFLFYLYGSNGICVDADTTFTQEFKELRPRDTVLTAAVSPEQEGTGKLYFMEGGGSTLDKEEAEYRTQHGSAIISDVIEVPLMNINTILKERFESYPLLLSIDIEGMDLPVLKSLDFKKYPIPVIVAETCKYSETHIHPKDTAVTEFMIANGYGVYANTYINTIFVNLEWFDD